MSKVTSKRTLNFPKLGWGIEKGEEKELPKEKDAQEAVLAHWAISEVGKSTATGKKADEKEVETKKDESNDDK